MTDNEKSAKKMMKKISTESYKGVRDFYPEDMFVENYIFDKMRQAVQKFGFIEYGASLLEPAELYRGKTSEEIVNSQTYTFTDRGGREITLRPEMTPTVARMVAARRKELSFPLRWFSIPNVFRYEQPQRGRLREHWQLNADIFGESSLAAEIEIISVAHETFISCGATESDFEIVINNRLVLDELWDKIGIAKEKRAALIRLIDTKEKMAAEKFLNGLEDITGDKQTAQDIAQAFASDTSFVKKIGPDSKPLQAVNQLISALSALGIKNVRFEPTLARGFDYYTGIVFEFFDTDPKNRRSLAGGGRYDNLLAAFGGENLPAVGFGLGDVTLRDFLQSHGLMPKFIPPTKLSIAAMSDAEQIFANSIAAKLRRNGLNVALDFSEKTIGDRIKKALKDSVPYFAVIGEDEKNRNEMTVKNLATKEERAFSLDEKDFSSLIKYLNT